MKTDNSFHSKEKKLSIDLTNFYDKCVNPKDNLELMLRLSGNDKLLKKYLEWGRNDNHEKKCG